ncbi:hypothetical protein ACWDCX_17500 [Streptomyces fungicidicus]|uniref:hypothetical protein n=1 Tax=Streptomyces fungicidicus TaxID=68203 RepID=UPI003685AC97
MEIAFAGQEQYISLYLTRGDVRDAFEERAAGQEMGEGRLGRRRPEGVDFGLVRDLLRVTAAESGAVC